MNSIYSTNLFCMHACIRTCEPSNMSEKVDHISNYIAIYVGDVKYLWIVAMW